MKMKTTVCEASVWESLSQAFRSGVRLQYCQVERDKRERERGENMNLLGFSKEAFLDSLQILFCAKRTVSSKQLS